MTAAIVFVAFLVGTWAVYAVTVPLVLLSMRRHPDRWPTYTAIADAVKRASTVITGRFQR